MHGRVRIYIFAFIISLVGSALEGHAQFKENVYGNSQNATQGETTAVADTADKLFSFKEWGQGLAHKQKLDITTMFAGSVFAPGTAQIYNKDYWKLPIIYGGIGALAGTGGYYIHQYRKSKKAYDTFQTDKLAFETEFGTPYPNEAPVINTRAKKTGTWLLAGAGLIYWGSLMDGVASFESEREPLAGRATLYSALLPGLGQIYNGELYKLPIYWGGLLVSAHFLTTNHTNYIRFKKIHNEATTSPSYSGPISGETAKWYRDVYRRYRDYSIVATALVYFLQVIDANVFAYMHDFEVTDDISMQLEPTLIAPNNAYAMHNTVLNPSQNAFGLKIGLTF
jgi:hypothetical protein